MTESETETQWSSSWIELDPDALKENLAFLREVAGPGVRISSVVKGNAYGHGVEQFLPLVTEEGIDHFAVFSFQEALQVYPFLQPEMDLMIMGWIPPEAYRWVIERGLEFFLYDSTQLPAILQAVEKCNLPAKVHLELETGLNRTGLDRFGLSRTIRTLEQRPDDFIVKGVCTHLAGAESIANHVRIMKQAGRFKRMCTHLKKRGISYEYAHTSCSAATISYPKLHMNMVRIGIMQYGFWPSTETKIHYMAGKKTRIDPLKRVITWKSRVMSLKKVRTGEFISYGNGYLANEDKWIAVIPLGYSSGYSRNLSNRGFILVNGYRARVIGYVNMNMILADVTNIPDVQVHDEVILIGSQGNYTISVASFGEFTEQINYELLTRIPAHIKRTVKP